VPGDGLAVRVDGDVGEIFSCGAFSQRVLLPWLAVQVQPSIRGNTLELVIKAVERAAVPPAFSQARQLCGRPWCPGDDRASPLVRNPIQCIAR
jgi:hypothetical protein